MLLTGIPVFHAEVTAIMDASARINPKALLGSDYAAGTILEMIPREAGSPDPVEKSRTHVERMKSTSTARRARCA